MELVIFIAILIVVIYIVNKSTTRVRKGEIKNDRSVAGRELTDDEIVTVILPTINSDGK